jgi:hypothetical protein
MKTLSLTLLLSLVSLWSKAQVIPDKAVQIKIALLAAPEDKRENASVYGYNQQGELILLREGSNELICIGDDPQKDGINVSCYHQSLEPFMKRGRELKKAGKSAEESFSIRESEVKAGKLTMPKDPASLFVFTAKPADFDEVKGEVKDGYLRYVIYIPYATSESTGLPLKGDKPGFPWIMDPGTYRAHIMINP